MNKRGPFDVHAETVVYKNEPWLSVIEYKLRTLSGHDARFSIVKAKASACVLPIDDHGNVYFLREYRFLIDRYMYNSIGGYVDDGETPEDTIRKELQEEAGIIAGTLERLPQWFAIYDIVDKPNHCFIARNLSFCGASPEETEDAKLISLPLDEALQWVKEGKIEAETLCLQLCWMKLFGGS
ncbi:MAG: NUDIX hydrolase [Alphaproteobacteria bacterium]|nr:MAG: NUDIX hydrolase [Alphaproteobacteria bacterium]